jgi:acyl-coenzyme A thioesterase PaaI-like protein
MDDTGISLQQRYAPLGVCFGCGHANPDGLHIRSFPSPDDPETIVADWLPETQYEAFEGILNGGIVGTLLDCHSNWTAAYHLMKQREASRPSTTVTLEYAVRLLRPTPSDEPVHLSARVVEWSEDRAVVEASLESGGKVTATLRGTFVAVKPDHPAYDRW